MAETTGIEWCDSTFNPWIGCSKVGPGCDHCYAEARMDKRLHTVQWGPGNARKRTSPHNWRGPIAWNAAGWYQCQTCGHRGDFKAFYVDDAKGGEHICPQCDSMGVSAARRRVFSASLSDWLDNEVPLEWVVDLLDLVRKTPELDWLLLTKRIGRLPDTIAAAYRYANVHQKGSELFAWLQAWYFNIPPKNVWIGATVVNQEEADRDIPKLLRVPAAIRFLSMEPLLGPVDLRAVQHPNRATSDRNSPQLHLDVLHPRHGVDWVIVGGESGPGAREFHLEWASDLVRQCQEASVPVLVKQLGHRPVPGAGITAAKGDDRSEWPEHLRAARAWPMPEPEPVF